MDWEQYNELASSFKIVVIKFLMVVIGLPLMIIRQLLKEQNKPRRY